jgi:hypothetical protein
MGGGVFASLRILRRMRWVNTMGVVPVRELRSLRLKRRLGIFRSHENHL